MTLKTAGLARGVLHLEAGRDKFRHARYVPDADIAVFVEHYWIVEWDLRGRAPHVQHTLPHPSVHLVLEREHSRIVGVWRGRFTRVIEDRGQVFGIKFLPGGFYPFVRSPVSRLTGQMTDAVTVLGEAVRALEAEVLSSGGHAEMIAGSTRFLRDRLPAPDPVAARVAEIVDRILSDRSITKVSQVANVAGMTVRQLQRLFSQYVGVSPKWVIQRYRIHEALGRLNAGEIVDWAKLATDLGYFDQPHFIRDFKTLTGETPADYARSRSSAAADEPE